MENATALAITGVATLFSIGLALLLECLLLKVILGLVAKAKAKEETAIERAPAESYRELRRPACGASATVSHLG